MSIRGLAHLIGWGREAVGSPAVSGHHRRYKTAGGAGPGVTVGGSGFVGTMGPRSRLFLCFLLWGSTELCSPQPFWDDETELFRPSKPPTVMVECQEAQLVVTVDKDLFGTRKLIRPADLTLGPDDCEPLASADTDGVVRFEVGLHECGNILQVRPGPPRQPRLWWMTREGASGVEWGCTVGLGWIPFIRGSWLGGGAET